MVDFDVNAAILENVHEYHSVQAAAHPGQDYDGEFTIREESFLEFFEEIIQRN